MCVDRTDDICVTLFGSGASEVDDQITPEEVKRQKDKRRYLEMADTAKHEKILKAMECRKQKNIPKQGTIESFILFI